MKFKLPSGSTGFWDNGKWTCAGSQMGRPNQIPSDTNQRLKLHLIRLPFIDGCYDRWGAYWGGPATVYIACTFHFIYPHYQAEVLPCDIQVFVRADCRAKAKAKVREILTNVRFYR